MDFDKYALAERLTRTVEESNLDSDSLCAKCRNGLVFRRRGVLNIHVRCSNIGEYVPSDIVECTSFVDKKSLTLYEMLEVGKVIDCREGISDGAYK